MEVEFLEQSQKLSDKKPDLLRTPTSCFPFIFLGLPSILSITPTVASNSLILNRNS